MPYTELTKLLVDIHVSKLIYYDKFHNMYSWFSADVISLCKLRMLVPMRGVKLYANLCILSVGMITAHP